MSAINYKTINTLWKYFNHRTSIITLKSHCLQPNTNSFLNIEDILTQYFIPHCHRVYNTIGLWTETAVNRLETQGKGLLDYSVVYPKTHASLVHPTIEWNGSWSLQSLFIHVMFFSGHALIGHSLCVFHIHNCISFFYVLLCADKHNKVRQWLWTW